MSRRALGCLMSLALVTAPALAQSLPQPIPSAFSRIQPVVARHGMVVSADAIASGVGRDILRQGGNAVDAAVATAFALAVTLPKAGNIGGGGFMLVHLAGQHKTIAIDYRETAPADTPKTVFLDADGNADQKKSQITGLGTGVPGTVAGMALAVQQYGSGKFTLAQLVRPAADLARNGIPVEGDLADSLARGARTLAKDPAAAKIFLRPDGGPLQEGDRLVQSDLATTLDAIAKDGPTAFYSGAIAEKIVAAVKTAGGHMNTADLAVYKAVERAPVRGTYRGFDIVSMPPPSSGGTHLVEILNILEGYPLASLGHNSAATIHLMAEAMKLAYADRAKYLGDPDFVKVPVVGLTSKQYAEKLREQISAQHARPAKEIAAGDPGPYESEQTTHFSVVDKDGNAVSNTYTLNFFFGVGIVAPGTGVLLNNELDDFAAKPNAPNAFGLTGGDANAPGPRKRPLSSMSPTIVLRDGQVVLVTGSPGGSFIITAVLQIILNVIDHGMNVAEAMEAPRVHDQLFPDELRIERGVSPDTIRALQALGHKVIVRATMGSTETIVRAEGMLMGAADTRQRSELAAGY